MKSNSINNSPNPNKYEGLPPINPIKKNDGFSEAKPDKYSNLNNSRDGIRKGSGKVEPNKSFDMHDDNPAVEWDIASGRPIQLITANPRTGKFTLNENEISELLNLDGKVSFVSVIGKYKTGKSFLLNKLLGLQGKGFAVKSSVDPCTQGIWIWSVPFYDEKENHYIFLLDTEGSHNIEKSNQHDSKVFALTTLLSSYLIYNGNGNIEEPSINELIFFNQFTKYLTISPNEPVEENLSKYTPKFVWALRDSPSEFFDSKGKPISPTQYLENALVDLNAFSKASETNKKIRQSLLTNFKDRECVTFTRPVGEDVDITKINDLNDNALRDEFNKQVKNLREKILKRTQPKQFFGVTLNFRMIISLARNFTISISSGAVPSISKAWETIIEDECKFAHEESIEIYDTALKQFLLGEERAVSVEDIFILLKNIRDQTLEKYEKSTLNLDPTLANKYKLELKDYIESKEQAALKYNEDLNHRVNESLLREFFKAVKEGINKGTYRPENSDSLSGEIAKALTRFDLESNGIEKTGTLITFLNSFHPELFNAWKKYGSNDELSKEVYNLKEKISQLEQKEKSQSSEIAKLQNEKANLEKELKNAQNSSSSKADLEKRLEETKKQLETAKALEEKARQNEKAAKASEEKVLKEAEEKDRKIKELAELLKKKKGCCEIF